MKGGAKKFPPTVSAVEGTRNAVGANAMEQYARERVEGKPSQSARKYAPETLGEAGRVDGPKISYRTSTGLILSFTGKRARVLELLATQGQGLTQWDCWPWHTRLGASVHALREAGLAIDTAREGPCRHARYFLRTPGSLIIQAENSRGPVNIDRDNTVEAAPWGWVAP